MKRKRAWKIGSAALAAALVIASMNGLTLHRARAANSATPSFNQEIAVQDVSDGLHTAGVWIPDLKIVYRLTPIPVTESSDSRYAENLSLFPNGSLAQDTKVVEYTKEIASQKTDKTGSVMETVNGSDIFPVANVGGANYFQQYSKVYRYQIAIVGVFEKDESGSNWLTTNLLDSTDSGITVPTATPIMDISVGSSGTIDGIAMWDSSGTNKLEGFTNSTGTTTAKLNNPFVMTASAADESNAITVQYYDVTLSSDYIGNSWASIHGGIFYSITFTNLPYYLHSKALTDLMADGNSRSWVDGTDGTNTDTATGTLSEQDEIVFKNIPVSTSGGTPVTYSAVLDFSKLAEKNLASTYASGIYYGNTANRISGVNSLSEFASSPDVAYYQYKAYGGASDGSRTTDEATIGSGLANAARFLIFDPDQLVVVGVMEHTTPAVLLIVTAAVLLFLLMLGRRREKEISDITWR